MDGFYHSFSIEKLRRMFYLVSPNETLYSTTDAVPNMLDEGLPWFFLLIFIELVGCWATKQTNLYEASDSFTSLGVGLLNRCVKVSLRSVELGAYCWLYDNYRLLDLNWQSYWVWLISFLLVDFGYYWFHRACHESMILWAVHQVHHSSDYLNLTTAMRHSPLERYVAMFFHLPAAFIVPPNVHVAHLMLSGLYKLWLHTELIRNLGPLEWVLSTPSNHRVHHGKNPYCVNKNYGGTLIIWDRMFRTFEAERTNERPVYGLVFSLESFDHLWAQVCMFKRCFWDKPKSIKGWLNKAKAVIFVPSWYPGLKYKLYEEVVPKIQFPVVKYKVFVPLWFYVYVALHMWICSIGYFAMAEKSPGQSVYEMSCYTLFVACSLQSFGFFFENRWWSKLTELLRCIVVYLVLLEKWVPTFFNMVPLYTLQTAFAMSIMFLLINLLNCYCSKDVKVKVEKDDHPVNIDS